LSTRSKELLALPLGVVAPSGQVVDPEKVPMAAAVPWATWHVTQLTPDAFDMWRYAKIASPDAVLPLPEAAR
jgi:hypothetical protein